MKIRIVTLVAMATSLTFAADTQRDFTRLISVGDSLSAGFTNFSLNVAGQLNGYTAVVARQAGLAVNGSQIGTNTFALPLISYPGIPPALYAVPGSPFPQILREPLPGMPLPGGQPSNLSVPGYSVLDALVHPFPGDPANNVIDALSDITFTRSSTFGCGPIPAGFLSFLSNVTQIPPTKYVVSAAACALALRPSAILVSIGNNDALQTLTLGLPPTNPTTFALRYAALLGVLRSTGADIFVSNIPDVRTIPFLVPVPAFASPQVCSFVPPGATAARFRGFRHH